MIQEIAGINPQEKSASKKPKFEHKKECLELKEALNKVHEGPKEQRRSADKRKFS